jgi:hypothetical protein
VHWTRLAYNVDEPGDFEKYQNLNPDFGGPLPVAPSDGVPGLTRAPRTGIPTSSNTGNNGLDNTTMEQLRQLIAEELQDILKH